ncbi:MAG: hypothetical protein ACLFP4_11805 [Spirochaetales bacterium]
MLRRSQAALLVVFLIAFAAGAHAQKRAISRATALSFDETVEATLVPGSGGEMAEFELEVTDDVFYLELSIEDSPADLDIEIDLGLLEGYRSETFAYNETLVLTRTRNRLGPRDLPVRLASGRRRRTLD